VAVGIAWLEPNGNRGPVKKQRKPAVTMNDVGSYLRDLDKTALIDLVLKHAAGDEQLHQRLLMQAAKKTRNASRIIRKTHSKSTSDR
jgi:hypothetical protein